ncbi:MAG: hypothetical protein H0U44_05510, partial [Flavisolibacter sp.]|nr:hypothetical protein [Flavisolibacter sp.]
MALPFAGATQDLTGIWRGYFITEMGEQYKLEFQVQQSKTQTVKGVSYSYLDTRFYGKASMTGNFVKTNKGFNIQELRTVEVRNLGGGGTCLMNYKFTYVKSGKEEFLEGTYIGRTENKQDPKKNGKWGDCGGGTVFLRKVPTSDFYVEPFLRNPPIVRKTVTPKKPATSSKKPATPPKVQNTKKPAEGNKQDSVIRLGTPEPIRVEKQAAKKIFVPEFTRSRSNDLVQTINVKHEEIIIKLFDNGEVDNDTVSLYLNGNLVLANQRLSTVPIVYKLSLS